MSEHKYILEPYKGIKTRYRCPSCQHTEKTFSLYIDTETGEHLHPSVGRCNRENNCSYHYSPKQYFQDNNISFDTPLPKANKPRPVTPPKKPVSLIPFEIFKASLNPTEFKTNHFVNYLINLFGTEVASELISLYFIGTSKYWNGATVFWEIDTQGNIRTGKIMQYSPITGKRTKEPFNHIQWVHKALKYPEFELKQCLFGEHLLIDKTKPVAIVESEKTAVIASVYLPQFIWVAVGGKDGLNAEKYSILKGRSITLFPDLSKPKIEGKPTAFESWSSKAKEFSHIAIFTVSDLLERKATEAEKQEGFDLADYLIKYDYKDFLITEPEAIETSPAVQPLIEVKNKKQPEPILQEITKDYKSWEQDIKNLEHYFTEISLPTQPVKLNQWSEIQNAGLFIQSHFATVKANNGNKTFFPYLHRLQELKQLLNTN
jgi:hypothetical protein